MNGAIGWDYNGSLHARTWENNREEKLHPGVQRSSFFGVGGDVDSKYNLRDKSTANYSLQKYK